MLVSLFTDASRCNETGASGWGYWVKSTRGRRYGGGSIKDVTESSNHAELISVCNGLYKAIKEGIIERGDRVLVQNDNMHVVGLLEGSIRTIDPAMCRVLKTIIDMSIEHNLRIVGRHVKGHQRNSKTKFFVNNLNDKFAKEGMRKKRAASVVYLNKSTGGI